MKKYLSQIYCLLICFIISFNCNSQTSEQLKKIQNSFSQKEVLQLTEEINAYSKAQKESIKHLVDNGTPKKIFKIDGTFSELVGVYPDGKPMYISIDNADSATATGASAFYSGGELGLDINGENMVALVWDGGAIQSSHQEFNTANKVEQVDDNLAANQTLNGNSFHMTHVAGTFAARGGIPTAKGMSPEAQIRAYVWDDVVNELNVAASNGYLVSNHSYGANTNNIDDWKIGAYEAFAVNYDRILNFYATHLYITSAGNNGAVNVNAQPVGGITGFDKLEWRKILKNGISVANGSNPQFDGNGNVTSFSLNGASSQGPSDDLRVKPDITGIGTGVYSSTCVQSDPGTTTYYNTYSGTSMAAPTVSGTALLIQQYYASINSGNFLSGYALKGLLLHTAIDGFGITGPDPRSGWGLVNGKGSAQIIEDNGTSALIEDINLTESGATSTYTTTVESDGSEPLKISISWFDVGSTSVVYNGTTPNAGPKTLINDVDLRVTKDGVTYFPWRLTIDGSAYSNANDGDNDVDTFERIDIPNPTPGIYTITVSHKGNLQPKATSTIQEEDVTLIASGLKVNSLNTETFNPNNELKIYPNPTKDNITISFKNELSKDVNVELTDVRGRIIISNNYSNQTSNFEKTIDLKQLKTGIYLIKINTGGEVVTKKILKQ